MSYPNPLTVRTVKTCLKNAAADAGMIGATAVVQGVMGSAWGWLLNRSDNRQYLNFIGELAGRTVSPNVEKIANQIYQNNHVTYKNGKYVVQIPASVRQNNLLNDDSSFRNNGHTYDVVNYGSDIGKKFKYNYNFPAFNNSNSSNNKKKKNKNKGKNNNKNNNHRGDHSENLLFDAVNTLCTRPADFSIFSTLKEKLVNLFRHEKPDDSAKALLQGCYEYLEESGFDAYPLMVNLITSQSDFSERSEVIKVEPEDLIMFRKSAEVFYKLTPGQKMEVREYLSSKFGQGPAEDYLGDLIKFSDIGVPPTKKRFTAFKILSIIVPCFIALRTLLTRPPVKDDQDK